MPMHVCACLYAYVYTCTVYVCLQGMYDFAKLCMGCVCVRACGRACVRAPLCMYVLVYAIPLYNVHCVTHYRQMKRILKRPLNLY